MEPGEIEEPEPTKSGKRQGRSKARRQHKRQQNQTSLRFEAPKRFRLDTHLPRLDQLTKRLPGGGYQAILNPVYTGPETPRWSAFRLSKVIKYDSLARLEKGVNLLSRYGARHSIGHKAKPLRVRIRHVKKEILMRQREFIEIFDDIFGRKPRSLLSQMDPTTSRSMSTAHRRVSRLLNLTQPKRASKSQFRRTKRFRKCHQYLKIRPPVRKRRAKSLRMGGMGTTMAITPMSDQGKDWHLPNHAHSH